MGESLAPIGIDDRAADARFRVDRRAHRCLIESGVRCGGCRSVDSHTAVAVDDFETVVDEICIRSCPTQAVLLREWADGFRGERVWAVESAQGLGYLLAQQLIAAGETVIDVPAVRASRVRTLSIGRSQKNDPNDARSVAIAALRADDLARVLPDDHTRILRLLAKRRRDLGRQKNLECSRLHALLCEMFPGGADFRLGSMTRVNALLDRFTPTDSMGRQRLDIAHDLVGSINELSARMKIPNVASPRR